MIYKGICLKLIVKCFIVVRTEKNACNKLWEKKINSYINKFQKKKKFI